MQDGNEHIYHTGNAKIVICSYIANGLTPNSTYMNLYNDMVQYQVKQTIFQLTRFSFAEKDYAVYL
jgi:hypothetical protein